MTIHWPTATIDPMARVEAIKLVWEPGISMTQLAARLGTTRNAISGLYHRRREYLADCPLNAPCVMPRKRRTKAEMDAARAIEEMAKAEAAAAAEARENARRFDAHGAGRPLMMLERRQCKWPVNDAERDQEHLFCGMPAEGPYCGHHASRSMRLREVR